MGKNAALNSCPIISGTFFDLIQKLEKTADFKTDPSWTSWKKNHVNTSKLEDHAS